MSAEADRKTIAAYAAIADTYAGPEPTFDDPAHRIACHVALNARLPSGSVLELGAGPGDDAAALRALGYAVVVTDGAARFVEIVRTRHPGLEAHVLSFDALADAWPAWLRERVEAAPFDAVWAHSCLVHVRPERLAAVLGGIRRTMRPGGVAFLGLARASVESAWVQNWGGVDGNDVRFDYHRPPVVGAALRGAGFAELEFLGIGWSPDSPYLAGPPAARIEHLGIEPYQVIARAV